MGICGDLLKTHGHRISSNMMRFDGLRDILQYTCISGVCVYIIQNVRRHAVLYTRQPVFFCVGENLCKPRKNKWRYFLSIPLPEWAEGCQEICSKKIQFSEFEDTNFQSLENETNFEDAFKGPGKFCESGITYVT